MDTNEPTASNMKRLLFLLPIVFLSGTICFGQQQRPSSIFDHFGDICCEDEKARLDNFAVQLRNEPEATAWIVYYGGRQLQTCGSKRKRLPLRGEAQARVARMKPYLVNSWPHLDGKRIVVVNGGYRESFEIELWIVPPGQQPPALTPTVKPAAIRFRSGRAPSGGPCPI